MLGKKPFRKTKILFLFLIFILVFFLGFSNLKIMQKREKLERENQLLEEKVSFLQRAKKELERAISQTKTESYWEGKIREEGYLKEGEKLVVILPPASVEKKEIPTEKKLSGSLLDKVQEVFRAIKEKFK